MGVVLNQHYNINMRSFFAVFVFALAVNNSLAVEWADSGIKLSTFQQACYANDEMYQIMKTGSDAYLGCQDGRGEYPTGGTMGKAFCLFDTLGLFANDEKMKINWDATKAAFGSFGGFVDDCKSTDYDTVNTALGHFYSCVSTKLRNEAVDQFHTKFFA